VSRTAASEGGGEGLKIAMAVSTSSDISHRGLGPTLEIAMMRSSPLEDRIGVKWQDKSLQSSECLFDLSPLPLSIVPAGAWRT